MSWTKKAIIQQAFEEAGIAAYFYDLTPEQLQSALQQMDSMMATWAGVGIDLGYITPVTPTGSNLDDPSNVPPWGTEAVYLNLALRLVGGFGKTIPPTTAQSAQIAYEAVFNRFALPAATQVAGSKNEIIQQALEDAGLGIHAFQADAVRLAKAQRRLDLMMASWAEQGIPLGYLPGAAANVASGIPAWAQSAVELNLALKLAGTFGKTAPPDIRIQAREAYEAVLRRVSQPIPVQYPGTLPRGAGNYRSRMFGRTFFPPADVDPLIAADGTPAP